MFRATSRLMLLALAALAVPAAFSQAVSFSKSDVPNYSLYHADFNSMGREDFILTAYASANCPSSEFRSGSVHRGWSICSTVCYALPSGSADYIAIGDFNNDGSPDLIVGMGPKQSMSIWKPFGYAASACHIGCSG